MFSIALLHDLAQPSLQRIPELLSALSANSRTSGLVGSRRTRIEVAMNKTNSGEGDRVLNRVEKFKINGEVELTASYGDVAKQVRLTDRAGWWRWMSDKSLQRTGC